MRFVVLAVLALSLAGCDQEATETYKGRTTSEWLAMSKDNDVDTRALATQALGTMKSKSAKDAVMIAAKSEGPYRVRVVALSICAASMSDDELLAVLLSMAKSANWRNTKPITCDPFFEGAERLGKKGSTLLPELMRVKSELIIHQSESERDAAESMIDASFGKIIGTK